MQHSDALPEPQNAQDLQLADHSSKRKSTHASSCLAQRPPVGANFKQVELYNKLVTQKFQELKHKAQSTRARKRSARETVKKLTLYLTFGCIHPPTEWTNLILEVLRFESCPDSVIELLAAVHDCRDRSDPTLTYLGFSVRYPHLEFKQDSEEATIKVVIQSLQ